MNDVSLLTEITNRAQTAAMLAIMDDVDLMGYVTKSEHKARERLVEERKGKAIREFLLNELANNPDLKDIANKQAALALVFLLNLDDEYVHSAFNGLRGMDLAVDFQVKNEAFFQKEAADANVYRMTPRTFDPDRVRGMWDLMKKI